MPISISFGQSTGNDRIPRQTLRDSLLNGIYTIWLFTKSDIKTIIVPTTLFGLAFARTGQISSEIQISAWDLLDRLPAVLFWVWINLLPSVIGNQATSIVEDAYNKPWRPLPSGRISVKQALWLMMALYPIASVASFYLNALEPCSTLMILAYLYNHSGLGDNSAWAKNIINACGYCCFISGATFVASGKSVRTISPKGIIWISIIWTIICSTVHIQDLQDMPGDAARSRKTVPLVMGETLSRVSIASAVMLWSIAAPVFWTYSSWILCLTSSLGAVVAWRILRCRTVPHDKVTFKIWNLWITTLFLVPAMVI